tara:strand:+ start:290 stop:1315 length:1026 start_codon:yes stop_codon:yes gene_type:complete
MANNQLGRDIDVSEPDQSTDQQGKTKEKLQRLDVESELRSQILPLCRLKPGEVWNDPVNGHRVGLLDATSVDHVLKIMQGEKAALLINDPPYNVVVGNRKSSSLSKANLRQYLDFTRTWVGNALRITAKDSHFYLWLGADGKDHFQPLPDVMVLLRDFSELTSRNFITMRNQRGYGSQNNWMWVRQELLHYVVGNPPFRVVYTDIPKILRGYYKDVDGQRTENLERGKSDNIRPGNVWVDIQQVFYRLEENVPGCYAQKPLKAIERIIETSSHPDDLVVDFFSHAGTTLIAGERLGRRVYTFDNDPIFAELTIRRLEQYYKTKTTGWQWNNPFSEIKRHKV